MRYGQLWQALLFVGEAHAPISFTYPEKREATIHMNLSARTDTRSCQVKTIRWGIPDLGLGVLTLIASLVLGGCSTHLGYVPHDVYAPSYLPYSSVNEAQPTYIEVKNWAFNVADGYDTRATLNRQAAYAGGLTALAATSALVGLAAFDPGNSAITGIPIGTTFLAGTMALYNNEQKAIIYGSASQTIRDLLIQSDCRMATKQNSCDKDQAAVCLHAEVSAVMGKVNHHITLLDPKNVADMLKDVASSVAAKQALVAQRQHEADEAADDLKRATSDNQADAAKKVKEAGDKLKEAQDDLQRLDKNAANTLADAAKASNFDDLKEVPNLCANTTDLCVMPDVCQFRK